MAPRRRSSVISRAIPPTRCSRSTPARFRPQLPLASDDGITDVRQPVASTCPADPFTQDGAACPANAVGTPFFAFTNTTNGPRALFAQAYQPENVQTAPASGVAVGQATLGGSVNPAGAPVQVRVEFGPTTSYGQSTAVQSLAPSETQTAFSAAVTGLPAGTLHYRAVATSDFGTFAGPDATVQIPATPPPPPPPPGNGHTSIGHAKVKGTTASVRVSCTGATGATCKLAFRMTVTEKLRGHKIIAITARKKPKTRKVVVTVGTARGLTLVAGQSKVVKISLNGRGKRLLASRHTLKVTLDVTQILGGGRVADALPDGHVQGAEAQKAPPLNTTANRPGPRPYGAEARAVRRSMEQTRGEIVEQPDPADRHPPLPAARRRPSAVAA